MSRNEYKELFDVWGDSVSDGIFLRLQNKNVPWKGMMASSVLDLEYFFNHSGEKVVSPLIERLRNGNDTLTDDAKDKVADIVFSMCNNNWKKIYDALFADYNPLWNTDATITETETRNLTNTSNGADINTHSGTDTHTNSGTDNLFNTGSDSITHSGTDNHATTENITDGTDNTTDTLTKTGTETTGKTGTETTGKSGTETTTKSGTETTTDKSGELGNKTTTDNDVYGYNSEATVNAGKTTTVENHNNTQDLTFKGRTDAISYKDRNDTLTYNNRKDTLSFENRTDKHTINRTYSENKSGSDNETVDLTDTTSYGKSENRTLDITNKDDYNSIINIQHNMTDTDKGTVEHETRRTGNIGITTNQQMITDELQLRKNMFFERVFDDLDRYLTIPIY